MSGNAEEIVKRKLTIALWIVVVGMACLVAALFVGYGNLDRAMNGDTSAYTAAWSTFGLFILGLLISYFGLRRMVHAGK